MMIGIFPKSPPDQTDYDIDFSEWLPDGDTITSADATVEPDGELAVASVSITDQTVKVWLNGGLDGETYTVTLIVGTAGGRTKEICFKIRVKEC